MLGTGQAKLTLGELRGATCLVQTSLLALHDASVAGQEASLLQGGAVRITIDSVQSAGNAEADGAGLAGGAATVNEDDSVELAFELEQNDRGVDLTLQQLGGEVLLQSAAVDGPLAVTRNQTDTGDSLLAATGAVARLNRGGAGASASVGLGGVVGELLFGLDNLGVVVFSAMILISSQVSLGLLRDLGDLEDLGLLRGVRVLGATEDTQAVELHLGQTVLRQHALTAFLMMRSGFFSSSSA